MAFKMNSQEATQGEIKPAGDYECVITGIEERTTPNGKTGLNFTLTIRNDVQGQKYGNACLFYTLWKAVEPTAADMSVNGYKFGQIMSVGKAAALPDGKDYADLNAFLADLQNKCVLAHMEHDVYNGKTQERVRWLNPTKHPNCRHVFKSKSPVVSSETFASSSDGNAQFAAAAAGAIGSASDDTYPF